MKFKKAEGHTKKTVGIGLGIAAAIIFVGVTTTVIATPLAARRYSEVTGIDSNPQRFVFQNAYNLVVNVKQNKNDTVTLTAPTPKEFFQVNQQSFFYS